MKKIKLKHVEKAIIDIYEGKVKHGKVEGYEQESFCGTNCCIWGHANAIAGNRVFKIDSFSFKELTEFGEKGEYENRLFKAMNNFDSKISRFVKIMKHFKRWPKGAKTKKSNR